MDLISSQVVKKSQLAFLWSQIFYFFSLYFVSLVIIIIIIIILFYFLLPSLLAIFLFVFHDNKASLLKALAMAKQGISVVNVSL